VICQRCRRNRAVIHTYCISDNRLVELHYCEECGKLQEENNDRCVDDSMSNLLEGLLNSTRSENYAVIDVKCEICGTTSKDIIKNRLVGCPNCYELFSDVINTYIDDSTNTYRKSELLDEESERLQVLRKNLREAVMAEDFEKAARLRDRISGIEKDGFLGDN
jgi:protein arginine kinase activator